LRTRPAPQLHRQVQRATMHTEPTTNWQLSQRPLQQQVRAAVERKVFNIDNLRW
jgi:hypothetical protein